jgi:hypothetical protein
MLISNPLKNLQQTLCKKVINKSDREMEFLTLIAMCKSFRPINFWGEFFCTSLNGFELNIEFCIL